MMHDIVVDELERHLSGNASRAFYDHLDTCDACRNDVSRMEDVSTLLRELRSADPENEFERTPQPSLGFYNRVTWRIVENQRREAWGLFSPGAAFFRRVAFASLLLLAGLGSFLVSREASFSGTDAAAIMAQHDPAAAHSETSDRDRMLVTLATYHE
jgi:hypothetical protein